MLGLSAACIVYTFPDEKLHFLSNYPFALHIHYYNVHCQNTCCTLSEYICTSRVQQVS